MTAGADTTTGLGRRRGGFVASYARHLQQIPEPPETFIKRELPPEVQELFDRLCANDVIHRVEYDRDVQVHRWRLDERVVDSLDQITTSPTPGSRVTPCCHYSGFENPRDGGYRCGFCGGEFDEFHVVEEVIDDE